MTSERLHVRAHGLAPFKVAVLHGGPGAPGEMQPVARVLSRGRGVLEPLQTRDSIQGQIEELREVLEERADPPVRLVGWSWGAWLGYLFAARHPSLVEKLFLVGSGPFTPEYVSEIGRTRLSRLSDDERAELAGLERALAGVDTSNRSELLTRYGALFERADAYDPIPPDEPENIDVDFDVFNHVWGEAAEMRESGALLEAGRNIRCEVVALHGDYDPHPARGVREPLEGVLDRFRFILLPHCGHKPWIERQAREAFFHILETEL